MRVRLARDLFSLFTKEGRSASVSELKRAGVQNVTLLGADQLAVLIERALDRALEHRVLELSEPEKALLLDRARQEFESLRSELQGLEGETARRRDELHDLESRIGSLTKDFQNANRSLDEEILAAARLDETSRAAPEPELAILLSVISQAGVREPAIAGRVATAVLEHLRYERDMAAARAASEQRARVELLERRLAKLNETLVRTEADLDAALQNTSREDGVASIYKTVQGLRATAKDFERKKALLSEIFQKNLTLQKGAAPTQEGRSDHA